MAILSQGAAARLRRAPVACLVEAGGQKIDKDAHLGRDGFAGRENRVHAVAKGALYLAMRQHDRDATAAKSSAMAKVGSRATPTPSSTVRRSDSLLLTLKRPDTTTSVTSPSLSQRHVASRAGPPVRQWCAASSPGAVSGAWLAR